MTEKPNMLSDPVVNDDYSVTHTVTFDLSAMTCRRCRKPLFTSEGVLQSHPISTDDRASGAIARFSGYHQRCIPPAMFHQFAGSLPAGQSPATSSLGHEHGAHGGLVPSRRQRKRPSRRKRYRATELRRRLATEAREREKDERTLAMTARDVLERGGKLRLCSCRTFSSDRHFITPNGYCRYCGKWEATVYRDTLGEDALQSAIDELNVHDRKRMRELLS